MEETEKGRSSERGKCMDGIGEDLIHNILSRLPAKSFACAACVSRSWTSLCNRILSRPKLVSALSSNPSLGLAILEVLDKVLSKPIRPHFALAYIAPGFSLRKAHCLITEKLGSSIPLITSFPHGIIGTNALTNHFREVQWEMTEDEDEDDEEDVGRFIDSHRAILLTVGFLPGLKVGAIPLLHPNEEFSFPFVDQFVMDIRAYASSVSGSTSPAAIIMFADRYTDMKPVLEKMDYAMPAETVIVGDSCGRFLYRGDSRKNTPRDENCSYAAIALLFVKDRNKSHGIGETQFDVTLSTGLSPIGPTYKAASVRDVHDDCSTWLTARREGFHETLDGETILNHIFDEIGDRVQYPAFYIGVLKRRKCSIGAEKVGWITSLAFHDVIKGDEEYLYVSDGGIKSGDSFCFYHSDPSVAVSSITNVFDNLRILKEDDAPLLISQNSRAGPSKKEVFGGIVFSCCGRGEPFFGKTNVDSSPFLDNFGDVTLAGSFCAGEIGRADSTAYGQQPQERGFISCCMHVYSTVYLVMSYTPPSQH